MMRFSPKQQHLVWIWLIVSACFLIWAALNSEGAYGGADSFVHYLIARYSWETPELLLDHWGKPLFTLLTSPFAQLGFIGVRLFNISCALLSAWLAYKTAKKLGMHFPIVAAIFSLAAVLGIPVYLSGLTEPLFALTLILSVYAASSKKWELSSIIISFIPLVRTEGFMFIPLWIFVLSFSKQWKAILFLSTGFLVYSLIGLMAGKDFWWIISDSPYGIGQVYGKGELLHFWNYREETFGLAYIIAFFLGIGWLVSQWKMFTTTSTKGAIWILITCSFLGYFVAHSLVWWLGRGSSAGLTRVMLGIVPLGAIICSAGFELFTVFKFRITIPVTLLVFIAMYWQLQAAIPGYANLSIPSKWGVEEVTLQASVDYLKAKDLADEYIVYHNPVIAFMMSLNPFTTEDSREKVVDYDHPEIDLPDGTIIIYDNHFGPVEGNLPQERLDSNEHFVLLNEFPAPYEHYMPNGDLYTVYIYQKVAQPN